MNFFWSQIFFLAIFAGLSFSSAGAVSDVFSELSLEQARQEAQRDGKFLLLVFTASWCPSCKRMESTTWLNDELKSWLKENAIVLQVDVEKDRKTTEALRVEAMPTLVLFTPKNSGKEFGRQDGYMSATELLQWLQGAKSGKTAAQMKLSFETGTEAWSRISKARELQIAGKAIDALNEYLWLWTNIKSDTANLGVVRNNMVSHELKQLCAVLPEAKFKIAELRDAAERSGNRFDWILLNGVLDENPRTLAWFDKIKTDPSQKEVIKANSSLLEPVLYSGLRWADAATYLYCDPLLKINEYYKKAQSMKNPGPDTEVAKNFDPFPNMVVFLYGAYIGAGREADAQKIADECLRLDNTAAMRETLEQVANGMRQARTAVNKTTKTPTKKP